MPWYWYLLEFLSGAFLANGVPHFVQGISGHWFQSPFAKPPGVGESSPVVNVVWGFANLVAGVRQRTGGAITVVFETATPPHAATPYPLRNDSVSAGEWNRAATANNRVEFAAEPGPSP